MPMARDLTDDEERLIDQLSKEVERRQKNAVKLGRKRNEVGFAIADSHDCRSNVNVDWKPKKFVGDRT